MQVPQAEALVMGVPRYAADLRLALEHEHLSGASAPQLDRGGEARGSAADDDDGAVHAPTGAAIGAGPP